MSNRLMPYMAGLLSSRRLRSLRRQWHELRRRLSRKPRTLNVVVRLDDPYSFLLVQVLNSISQRFAVEFQFRVIQQLQAEMYPAPDKWAANARHDAALLADLYGLRFPDPDQTLADADLDQLTAQLLASQASGDFIDIASRIFAHFWTGQPHQLDRSESAPERTIALLRDNEAWLERQGHYLSATIYYQGEWYWGIDRLDHLERRLIASGVARRPDESVQFDRQYRDFCAPVVCAEPPTHSIEVFYSARSPYSYLGLERAERLAQHYQVELKIKPVLPMVMRNMAVPASKKWYIFHDTKREADKYGIGYGRVADPVGCAVERLYSLFEYAKAQNQETQLLLSFGRGVNAEGIDGSTDRGLRRIVERADLSWAAASTLIGQTPWQRWAQRNLDELFSLGLWGVPCFRYQNAIAWGQDRLWVIEKAIRDDINDD